MKIIFVNIIFLAVSLTLMPQTASAEESEYLETEGLATIDFIDLATGKVTIGDIVYKISNSTKFLTQPGGESSSEKFYDGMLVYYITDEDGYVVSLREEYDFEGELEEQSLTENEPSQSSGTDNSGTVESKTYYQENGVWKN